MSNVAAFFDIDGTIYRDSLLIDHFKKLIKYDIIPREAYNKDIKDNFNKWDNRQGDYESYMLKTSDIYRSSLVGLRESDVEYVADRLIHLNSKRVYTYTRDKIEWHLKKGHLVFFISGSPSFLVEKMAKEYGATDYRGSEYLAYDGKYTGEVIAMWDHQSKSVAMDEFIAKYDLDLGKSYAYGDTNGDLFMLERVGYPVAVNPSKELISKLKKNDNISENLKIVVERKDTVYVLDKNIAYIR